MQNAGVALTKWQILENVWDSAYEGDPNILEVYVGYLRKKVDAPFGRACHRDRARSRLPAGRRRRLSPALLCGGRSARERDHEGRTPEGGVLDPDRAAV